MHIRHLALVAIIPVAAGCFHSRSTRIDSETLPLRDTIFVTTPIRAHLADGSAVVFRHGASVADGMILGRAVHHDPLRKVRTVRDSAPLDSVIAVEAFHSNYNIGRTLLYSVVVPIAFILFAAICMSC